MKSKSGQQVAAARHREKPNAGWLKINVDASVFQDGNIGCGAVVRDAQGQFRAAMSKKVEGKWSPREAEAIAFKEALSWIIKLRYGNCVFETDSKTLVQACNGASGDSFFGTIVDDCTYLLKHINHVLVRFGFRYANRVTHELARVTNFMSDSGEWLVTPPSFISHVLDRDMIS